MPAMGALNIRGHPRKVKSAQRPPKNKRNPDLMSFDGRFSQGGCEFFSASVGSKGIIIPSDNFRLAGSQFVRLRLGDSQNFFSRQLTHAHRPDKSRNILRPPSEKRPANDTTPGFLSFAGCFRLLLGAQQKKSAHFQYKSTLLVEQQKIKKPSKRKMFIKFYTGMNFQSCFTLTLIWLVIFMTQYSE